MAALVAFVGSFKNFQFIMGARDCIGIAKALIDAAPSLSQYTVTAGEFDAAMAAFTKGEMNDQLPAWCCAVLSLMGKLLGISTLGVSGYTIMPEWVRKFCKESKISPASLVNDVITAVEDVLLRAKEACEM